MKWHIFIFIVQAYHQKGQMQKEAPLGPCARPVPWPHEGLPLLPVVENEFYGYKIIICMLWLVKQSTLTWLLLTFMFPRTLFKLQSAMSSPDLTSPAQPGSAGAVFWFWWNSQFCKMFAHRSCSLLSARTTQQHGHLLARENIAEQGSSC